MKDKIREYWRNRVEELNPDDLNKLLNILNFRRDLDPDFIEILDQVTIKVGKDNPSKTRFEDEDKVVIKSNN